jgi:hypothetical protein
LRLKIHDGAVSIFKPQTRPINSSRPHTKSKERLAIGSQKKSKEKPITTQSKQVEATSIPSKKWTSASTMLISNVVRRIFTKTFKKSKNLLNSQ